VVFTSFQINFIIVFFLYGLAFFTMGMALLLETNRTPLLAEKHILRPLVVFGLLHGIHEWIEIYLIQGQWTGVEFSPLVFTGRVVLLAVSFIALLAFGLQALSIFPENKYLDWILGIGIFIIYFLLMVILGETPWNDPENWRLHSDIMARYLLAVPGGIFTAITLWKLSVDIKVDESCKPVRCLRLSAFGFTCYALTQIFVSQADFGAAKIINSTVFMDLFGFPVQAIRATVAILATIGLLRTLAIVEEDRKRELVAAQEARLNALERVQEQLVRTAELRREILHRTVLAQEEERRRIARELHDETSQTLTAFRMNIAALQARVPDTPDMKKLTGQIVNLSNQMAQDLSTLIYDLRPAHLDDLGLVPALRFLTDRVMETMGLNIDFTVEGNPISLGDLQETVLYRVAQEALTNVAKHANTKKVSVYLSFEEENTEIKIIDKGVGFKTKNGEINSHGMGVINMRERIQSIGGKFNLKSKPGEGTTILAEIPRQLNGEPV
jgi:signal transduction histidine kinase